MVEGAVCRTRRPVKNKKNYEEGQYVTRLRLPAKEKKAQEETGEVLKGNRFAILATESE